MRESKEGWKTWYVGTNVKEQVEYALALEMNGVKTWVP